MEDAEMGVEDVLDNGRERRKGLGQTYGVGLVLYFCV